MLQSALQLDAGLFADADHSAGARAFERRIDRHIKAPELGQRRRATSAQSPSLAGRYSCDEAQVVIRPSASDTLRSPSTDIAMFDRLRVGVRRWIDGGDLVGHRSEEAVACRSVVGHVVVDAESLDGAGAPAEGDMHPLRSDALDGLEQVDVGADLEHGAGFYVAGQLRVGDLVVVRAETRRLRHIVHAQQEVGMAAPGSIEEGRLIDHVRAGGHCPGGFCGRGTELVAAVLDGTIKLDRDCSPTFRLEVGKESSLVLEPALADDVELRVVPHRPLDEAGQRGTFQLSQVFAGEVSDEIRGRVDGAAVDRLHDPTLPARHVRLYVTPGMLSYRSPHDEREARGTRLEPVAAAVAGEAHRPPDPRGP